MLLKKNIPISYIFGQIKYELLFVAIYGIAIEVLYQKFRLKLDAISIPMTVSTVFGTILSLLLAFRSNQAYDRWWEARIIWGAIVNDSRTLSRQILTLTDGENEGELKKFQDRFIKRQIAWCYALAKSLRNSNPMPVTEGLLDKKEREYIAGFDNKPAALLDLHAKDLKIALKMDWTNRFQQVAIDQTLTRLCDSMGKCERIKNTVFPSTYSLYIHVAVMLFVLLLPFGLSELFGFLMVPVLMMIATFFFLIEKMAVQLQDPFENKATDTPVMSISRTIERNLRQMMSEETELPKVQEPNQFYIL